MNQTIKRILIGFGILTVAFAIMMAGMMLKVNSETSVMTPLQTGEVITNIISIKDSFSNLYLIRDSDQYIAIDGGNDIEVISQELNKLNIENEKVKAVFLTHTDGDHVAAIKLFTNAKVYLSEDEEQLINGKKSRMMFFGNKIETNDYLLHTDKQSIVIGNLNIKVILTQGHTPGSVCYLINDKYLFTGDLLSLNDGKVGKFNEFFNMDTKTSIESLGNIVDLPNCEYIFTAHYGYTNDYKNAVKDWKTVR